MRTFGRPSASTVASAMALGSAGSARLASSNQAANSRKGSSASVKSPAVNHFGCCIGDDSDIPRSIAGGRVSWRLRPAAVIVEARAARLWRRLAPACCAGARRWPARRLQHSYQLNSHVRTRRRQGRRDGRAPCTTAAAQAGQSRARGAGRRPRLRATRAAIRGAGRERQGRSAAVGESAAPARAAPSRRSRRPTPGRLACRDFLASYVRNGTESWMQGEACRGQQGRWEVRHMKPWQRT